MKDCLRKFISIILLIAYSFTAFPVFAITTELRNSSLRDTTYTYGSSNELGFAGRLKKRSDASGVIEYEYGKLGETIKETRSLNINSNLKYYCQYKDRIQAEMSYKSNYLGQIEEIIYPNGEILQYIYDEAGQVERVVGDIDGEIREYVRNIGYDEYGQRNFIEYGNGVKTNYTYDPQRRWLKDLYSDNNNGQILQSLKYSFDSVGNVLSYTNDCCLSGFNKTEQHYTYDNLYQLIKAEGTVSYQETSRDYKNFKSNYTQTFEYDSIGNLVKKTSKCTDLDIKFNQDPLNYTQDYIYDSDYAHRLKSINNQTFFLYDKNGNIIETSDESYEPKYDAQFRTFLNSQGATIYTFKYDPVTGDAPLVPRKPDRVNRRNFNERNMMIESSGIMEDTVSYSYDEDNKRTHKDNTSDDKYSLIFNDYYSIYFSHHNRTGEHYNNIMLGNTRLAIEIFNKENAMNPNRTYFFHSDHLGSNTLITDTNGDIYQYTEYTPYGEVWAEVTQNKTWEYFYFNASYRFTGKPRDEETGYYYFGARYFDPYLNIWTSSDPAIEKFMLGNDKNSGVYNHLNLNTYHYGNNNPIKYIDPDGNAPGDRFESIDSAAKDFGKIYNNDSIKNNKEYGSTIYKSQEKNIDDKGNEQIKEYFYYTIPNSGDGDSAMPYASPQKENDELAGIAHTHGAYDKKYKNNEFSSADKKSF